MIDRLYLKQLLGFENVDLDFDSGLVVMSGPSGAGKSVLMGAILASFGLSNIQSKICELEITKPDELNSEQYDLDDELIIKSIKKDRIRYYLNEQNISKKSLEKLFTPFVNYLSVRDGGGFESDKLISLIDGSSSDLKYKDILEKFGKRYEVYENKRSALQKINDDEKRLRESIEFYTFEVDKINEIDPKVGEDKEMLQLKRQLSKVDKINESSSQAEEILSLEESVAKFFELTEINGSYFWDALNQLRSDIESSKDLASELEDMDVEDMLNRLEKLNDLKNRYGSIEEALIYRDQKQKELREYKHIENDKSDLESFLTKEQNALEQIANDIHMKRLKYSELLEKKINSYLLRLKLPKMKFVLKQESLYRLGNSRADIALEGSSSATLSGGEYNRLRLSLMVASLDSVQRGQGVIILDEIDANVSGDESIAIAEMIASLSDRFQVFAISHQPHLSAKANQHILVEKIDGQSSAKILDKNGRTKEISRIIGGEIPTDEAVAFAKRLLEI